MSDFNNSNRKKKQRSNRPKSFTAKAARKKRKSRPTSKYQENEKEVQALLESTSLSIDLSNISKEVSDVAQSVEFFCRTSDDDTTRTMVRGSERLERLEQRKLRKSSQEIKEVVVDSGSEEESENSEMTKTVSEQSSTHGNQTTASTYLQIDAEPVTQMAVRRKHAVENELLYQPEEQLHFNMKLNAEGVKKDLTPNTNRMLNRYNEEAKAMNEEISKNVITVLQKSEDQNDFMIDKTLYRTFCEYKFNPIFCEPTVGTIDIPTRKFVKLYIRELRFTEHPLLLEEHSLVNILEDMYEQYSQRLKMRLSEKLASELQTNRKIVNALLVREASEVGLDSGEKRIQSIERHLLGVKTLRGKLYQEQATNKKLLKDILDTWIKLKNLRKNQAFQCTRFKLRIKVEEPRDVEAESRRWTQRFETDLNEIYREELELYYRAKRLWRQRYSNVNDDDDAEITPKTRPRKPDIEQLSEELKAKLAECYNAPGEPQVDVLRSRVSDEEFYALSGSKSKLKSFLMKIYFDRQFVGVTRSYRMEPDLRLTINEAIGIFLERRLPKDIRIALYEKSKLTTPKKIANILIPLPLHVENFEYQTQTLNFSSHKQPISGRLSLRFQCDEQIYPSDMVGVLFPPPQEHTKIPKDMLKKWYANKLLQTIDTTNNNEENLPEAETSDEDENNIPESSIRKSSATTCTFEEERLQFCTMDELENNPRFRLLRSRHLKNDMRTKDLRFIPSLEHELEFDWSAEEEDVLEAGNWMNPIDLHKHEGKKYLKTLYEAIENQCARLNKVMENSENLLIGDEPASWSSFFQALALIFHSRRPLNPVRNTALTSNTLQLTMDAIQNFRIVFNVVRATGIPVRSQHSLDTDSRQRSSGSSNMFMTQNFKYSNVRPFITLSYRDKFCRTITAEGSNPTWNEQLVLQLSGSTNDLRDELKISLFDEVIENHINDDIAVRNMDIYQRIQTNWLGDYRIPIGTILARQKIEGVFELNSSKVLIGYKRPSLDNLNNASDTNIMVDQYPEIKETVRLWFYINLEPTFSLARLNTSSLECSELKEIRKHLFEWGLEMKELQPQRFIEPLACTVNGKRVCMTRLLEPIPLAIEASENLLDSACRFVSLLSTPKHYDACMGFEGIWLDNQTLLDTTWASAKDLGLLLCNFLLTIGMRCWLVLGIASPYGETAFVLFHTEDGDLLLIDPCSGKRYAVKDVFCPLSKINVVVAQDNIYCNIQTETRFAMTNFNLNDKSCWLPAFTKKNPAPLGGVQKLNYIYSNAFNTGELRKNIERKIMKKINSWRTMRKTIWNRAFQLRLQSILQELEHVTTFVSGAYEESKYTDQLAAEFPSYKLYGFTLNFPYTNLTSISDRVKSTGLHLNSDKKVEFSLAVYIHAYPNNVLSVWIFLLSIIPM